MNELTILKQLQTELNNNFNTNKDKVATASGATTSLNITKFQSKSLNEQILEDDYIGLIYIKSTTYNVADSPHPQGTQEIMYSIQCIFPDNGDLTTDISIAQMAIKDTILDHKQAVSAYGGMVIQSTEPTPLEFGPKGDTITYVMAGLTATITIGF